jgi:RNA polymerase sigma factor (sigma-70 family)
VIKRFKEGAQGDPKWKPLRRPTITARPKWSAWAQSSKAGKRVDVTPMLSRVWDKGATLRAVTSDRLWADVYEHCAPIPHQGPLRRHRMQPAHERILSDTKDKNGNSLFWKNNTDAKPLTFAKLVTTKPRPLLNFDTSYVSLVKRRLKLLFKHQKEIEFDDALNGVLELIERYKDMERYDRTKSSLKTYLNHVVKSRFTDFARSYKAANKLEIIHSINDRFAEEDARELEEILPHEGEGRLTKIAEIALIAADLLTPQEHRVFTGLAFDGKSIADLAKELSLTSQRVYQLKSKVKSKIEDYYAISITSKEKPGGVASA